MATQNKQHVFFAVLSLVLLGGIAASTTGEADNTVLQSNAQPSQDSALPQSQLQSPSPAPDQTIPSSSIPALKGSVHGLHLLNQGMLGHMGSTAETIKKDTLVVINELAMPTAITGTPANVVGSTVIMPMPAPSGVMYSGHEDPNIKAASAAINSVIDRAKLLEDEISTAVLPAETDEYVKELWDKIREISEKLYIDLNDLARLAHSEGASYETTKMEKIALRIYDKAEAINKLRRRIAQELHDQK